MSAGTERIRIKVTTARFERHLNVLSHIESDFQVKLETCHASIKRGQADRVAVRSSALSTKFPPAVNIKRESLPYSK